MCSLLKDHKEGAGRFEARKYIAKCKNVWTNQFLAHVDNLLLLKPNDLYGKDATHTDMTGNKFDKASYSCHT